MKPNILVFDIETINRPYTTGNVVNGRQKLEIDSAAIVSFSYAWGENGKVHNLHSGMWPKQFKKDPFNDKPIMKEIAKIVQQADFMVAHYGSGFDKPVLKTRFILNGLKEAAVHMNKLKLIDTCLIARSTFRVKSNSLRYLCKILGLPNKLDSGNDLWVGVLRSDMKAMKAMAKYNNGDVVSLQALYKEIKKYAPNHPALNFDDKEACPTCTSTWVVTAKRPWIVGARQFVRHHCRKCGSDFKGPKLK